MKLPLSSLPLLVIGLLTYTAAHAADPADWRIFNNSATANWADSTSWTASGLPTPGGSLVINFDPTKAGTTGSTITTTTNTVNNNAGNFQLGTLNLAGVSSGSDRTVTIGGVAGSALLFGGSGGAINVSTTTNGGTGGLVHYVISSNILLNGDLNVSLGGTGNTTIGGNSGTASTLSANTAGEKIINFTGAGTAFLGGNIATVISDGAGKVGVTQSGTGTLFMGGANTFTGDLLIKSGAVAINSSTIGTATAFGAGTIKIGDSSALSTANATLTFSKSLTFANNVLVQAGGTGGRLLENTGGNSTVQLNGTVTLQENLTARYTGTAAGGFTFGGLAGSKTLTLENANGSSTAVNSIGGDNAAFTGTVNIVSGTTRATTDTALNASNTVVIDSAVNAPTFNINQRTLTIGGLANGANGGGTVTNGGGARVLTLGGNGSYVFGGTITAVTTANLALTVALTGGGSQTLGGTLSYDGATLVNSGTLIINGDALAANGNVTVATGATLGGTGLIGGAATINGNLSAGNSAGTLTFNNNLTLNGGAGAAGATAIFEGNDLVDVNGTLTLNDGWNLTLTGGFHDGGSMVLFTYTTPGATLDLTPDIDASALGFTPTSPLFLVDTGSAIELHGISAVPEPAAGTLGVLALAGLLYRRRR
jgi:fibronectin-binding autotransporter adhesin